MDFAGPLHATIGKRLLAIVVIAALALIAAGIVLGVLLHG